jgi:hypothetical protein
MVLWGLLERGEAEESHALSAAAHEGTGHSHVKGCANRQESRRSPDCAHIVWARPDGVRFAAATRASNTRDEHRAPRAKSNSKSQRTTATRPLRGDVS